MNKFKLTYFTLGSMKPVNLEFKNFQDLCDWIKNIDNKRPIKPKVYLLTHDAILGGETDFEIFISEYLYSIYEIVATDSLGFHDCTKFHLHEYESFQDAYDVALNMREENPLCYGD